MKLNSLVIILILLSSCSVGYQNNFNRQKFTRLSDLKNSETKIESQLSANPLDFIAPSVATVEVDHKLILCKNEVKEDQFFLSEDTKERKRETTASFIKHKFPSIEKSKFEQTGTLQIDPIITDRNSYNWFFFIGLSIFILTILNYIFVFLKKTRGKDFFLWAASIGLLTTWIMSWGLIKGSSNVTEEDRDNGYKAMLILAKIVAVAGIVVLVFLLTLLTVLIVISLK